MEPVAHLLADAAGDGVGVAVAVDHVGHAARHEHRAQRGDEGRELELAHEHAVEHAYQQAGHQRDQDGGDGMHAAGHQRAGDHGAHADHRAGGQLDVAGDEQVALADADDEVLGHGAREVDDVAPREHRGVDQAERDVDDDESGEGRQRRAHAAHAEQPLEEGLLAVFHTIRASYAHWPAAILFSNRVASVRISFCVVSRAITSPVI